MTIYWVELLNMLDEEGSKRAKMMMGPDRRQIDLFIAQKLCNNL